MSTRCRVCTRTNPADALYCYHDGRPLLKNMEQGPLHAGSRPFLTPFIFSDGFCCADFNQLALACDARWEEARALLAGGAWAMFFAGIGRGDLAATARQAASEPDLDRGLGLLLEKLPADPDFLTPPRLAIDAFDDNLGPLSPGTDRTLRLVLVNQGMCLLHGVAWTECDWLTLSDHPGPSHKLFQTRTYATLPVRILGSQLRAGQLPLEVEIVIDSNGGSLKVPLKVDVPIRPFPNGETGQNVLAGARSPRAVALLAKEHPNEAAALFEQGAVRAWYASNGWTYPVAGADGIGKGAVQQFLEALGLTRPPRLEINTLVCFFTGRVGERLRRVITVSTTEAKYVYAQAWSNRDWLTFGPTKYLGNKVKMLVELVVPADPGAGMEAEIVIEGNGRQQFVVPVRVQIAREHGHNTAVVESTILDAAERSGQPRRPSGWQRWMGWMAQLLGGNDPDSSENR